MDRGFQQDPSLSNKPFEKPTSLESPFIRLAEKYTQVVSHEIWGYETIYSTLYQIKHYKECGMFDSDNSYRKVLGEYDQLIDLIFKQAEEGRKLNPYIPNYKGSRIKMYFTPMITADNSMIFHTIKDKNAVICSQMSGVVISDTPHWVLSTENWLNTCKENGTLLSKTGNHIRIKLQQEYQLKKQMLGM